MTQKLCRKCGETKRLAEFRFLHSKHRYLGECKECERNRSRAYYRKYNGDGRSRSVAFIVRSCKKYGTEIIQDALTKLENGNG